MSQQPAKIVREQGDNGYFTGAHHFSISEAQFIEDNRTTVNHNYSTPSDKHLQDLIAKLQPVDNETKHHSILEQKQIGTCTWLPNNPGYISWLSSEERILCLFGQPGSGKSVLCSSVIEELQSSPLTQVIYHYCDFRDQHSTNVKTIFHSLLAQLISELLSTTDRVVDWIIDHLSSRDEQQYVVIDALDECEDFEPLIHCLLRLASIPKVSLLLSSRQERDIYELLCDHSIISLGDEGMSVLADIIIHIDHELKDRRQLSRFPSSVKADIALALMEKADGMFRWVQCQLDSLMYCRTAGAVKEALLNLPSTLYETYERILYSIDAKARPLTLTEINSALQIEVGQPKLNEDFCLFDEEDILSICKSLVMCHSGVVSLSHFTVKEFLVQETLADLNLGHYTMCNSLVHRNSSLCCLTYLLLDAFKMGPATSKESYAQRLKEYPFLPYAATQLPDHLLSAPQNDSEIYSLVSRLLLDPTLHNFNSFSQTEHFMANIGYTSRDYKVLGRDPSYIDFGQCLPWFIPWCRTAWIARRLLHERPDWLHTESFSSTWFCGTPLHLAILRGDWDIAEAVLDSGADIDKKSNTGVSINNTAYTSTRSFRGLKRISALEVALGSMSPLGEGVKLLLGRGAKVSSAELNAALYHVREEFIPLLLEQCPVSQLQLHERSEIIVTAVRTGDPRMVQILLDAGCDPESIDPGSGKSTLQAAFELRSAGVISVLIEAGASLGEVHRFASPDQLDWASRHKWYSQCLNDASMGPSNSKRGFYSTEELQSIRDFLVVTLRLPLNVATLVMDLAEQWANIRVSKNKRVDFTENSAETPYIRLAMPNGNLRSIIFITSSHDQGYSGESEHTKGTYQCSHTWFEAAIMRQGEQVGDRRFIQANVQAASQSRTHRNIWSIVRADRNSDLLHWMMSIRAQDEIWMLPKAQYPGWVNYVQAAEITICYTFPDSD
ncbi:hypothetical protein BDP27DRAFT_1418517 [Rhodocollybia butyracea]|uniref:NACHT domain-containing protein n=1 Tax=Rhodocollybia butyracea TaxID=206335 RepID=A0A9P5UAD4_9AGAR|nr:hypothetical protein BDP27DRAFT_1418517 [Rhodocollybia butyracea]